MGPGDAKWSIWRGKGEVKNVIFKGKYEHTLDAKGRLFVPVKYREGLGDSFVICQAFFQNCLWAFSSQDFDEMAEKMDFSLLDEQARAWSAFLCQRQRCRGGQGRANPGSAKPA